MSLAVNTIPTPYIHVVVKRRKNTWYTVKDGNWTDPLVWESNAIRRWNYPGQNIPSPIFPQVGDDVYIGHVVTLNTGTASIPIIINNLYISGSLKANNSTYITINGNLQAIGSVDFTSSNINLTLNGVNNYVTSFTGGSSTVIYNANGDQPVMVLPYYNLTTSNNFGTKYLTGNTTVSNNVSISGISVFDSLSFDLTVTGSTSIAGTFNASGSGGNLIFVGLLNSNRGLISFNNQSIEFRGGYTNTFALVPNFGTGSMNFTTNNQTFNAVNVGIVLNNSSVTITGAITVTFTTNTPSTSYTTAYTQINTINGTISTSKLINTGTLIFTNTGTQMGTGIFDYTSNSNIIGYNIASPFTLPYSNYYGLYVTGGSTATMSSDLNLTGILGIGSNTTLDASSFNLTVNGVTSIGNIGTLYKIGAGNIVLVGALSFIGQGNTINITSGLTLELRGGKSDTNSNNTFTGGFTLLFTTNNQTFAGGINITLNCNISISGAITVINTLTGTLSYLLNGNNAASIFDNRGTFHYQNATAPMVTGLLYCNQAANTWYYDLAVNQDIQPPSDPATPGYKNLTLAGSGAKRLLGNVSVKGTYTLTAPATLDLNGFTLTNP